LISPNVVPLNTTALPIVNPTVDVTVIKLVEPVVSDAVVTTDGDVNVTIGGFAYPRILPNKSISKPGGNAPSLTCTITGLLVLGLVYVTGILIHKLSQVLVKFPLGVVNCGIAEPEMLIENVLSLILPKLSVTLIANVDRVFPVTSVGVPDINPAFVIDNPPGRVPLSISYVTDVEGNTADAES
jgi:hypothetical protein